MWEGRRGRGWRAKVRKRRDDSARQLLMAAVLAGLIHPKALPPRRQPGRALNRRFEMKIHSTRLTSRHSCAFTPSTAPLAHRNYRQRTGRDGEHRWITGRRV